MLHQFQSTRFFSLKSSFTYYDPGTLELKIAKTRHAPMTKRDIVNEILTSLEVPFSNIKCGNLDNFEVRGKSRGQWERHH
jgi:hypothetical protein